ncbi:MAG: hemerythrin family protein [Leptospiraceae bacterium]|nr:hemerythrin family protein [Leptospiraceae bacterium]
MEKINWNESFAIGVDAVDEQHKYFVSLLNELRQQVNQRDDNPAELQRIIGEFKDYTVYHFNTEEQLMRDCEYPYLMEHQQEHSGFRQHVLALHARAERGEFPLLKVIATYMTNWLLEHIQVSDARIAEYVNRSE